MKLASPWTHGRSPEAALTLIELVVVAGIALLLLSLLLPQVQKLSARAGATKCAANLSQIARSALLYAAENDGVVPGARMADSQDGVLHWYQAILPYIPKNDLRRLSCPAWQKKGYFNSEYGNYSWNFQAGWWNHTGKYWEATPRRISSYAAPARTSLAVDGSGKTPSDLNSYYQYDYGQPNSGNTCPALHQDGFNTAFVDGHVERKNKSDILNLPRTNTFWSGTLP